MVVDWITKSLKALLNRRPSGYPETGGLEVVSRWTEIDAHNHAVVTKYKKRISGPLLDCSDIHIEVPRLDYKKLSIDRLGESSAAIRERVQAARERQRIRFEGSDIVCNSDMCVAESLQYWSKPMMG